MWNCSHTEGTSCSDGGIKNHHEFQAMPTWGSKKEPIASRQERIISQASRGLPNVGNYFSINCEDLHQFTGMNRGGET